MTGGELADIRDRVLVARAWGDGPAWRLAIDALALVHEVEDLRRTLGHVVNALVPVVPEAAALIRERVAV